MLASDGARLRQRHAGAPNTRDAHARSSSPARASASSARPLRFAALLPLVALAFFVALIALVWTRHSALPAPLGIDAPLDVFSEARARLHLRALVSLPPRTTGSVANELGAVRYLLTTLRGIQASMPANGEWTMELSVQRPSGSFDLDFLGGFTSSYTNVSNVVARIVPRHRRYPSRRPEDDALLISGHFDAALGTPAATDDATNVANMIEALRTLVHSPATTSALVFLFNGAEETILQASHGFITQHPWAGSVAGFINLEGAGGSGREYVFQTGPRHAWMAGAYSRAAPYPFASIVGQDIFQSGLIPSDTDFRIFRDFAALPGIDVAYIANGHVYHTALDKEDQVDAGSMQRCGENMVATARTLADEQYLILTHRTYQAQCSQPKAGTPLAALLSSHQSAVGLGLASPLSAHDLSTLIASNACVPLDTQHDAVYFDVLGMVVVIYSASTAGRLNVAVLLAVGAFLAFQSWSRRQAENKAGKRAGARRRGGLLRDVCGMVLSFLAAILSSILVGLLLDLTCPMRWFTHHGLVIGLFFAPATLGFAAMQRWVTAADDDEELSQAEWTRRAFEREERSYEAALCMWAALLCVLTAFGIGSAFLALSFCIAPLFARTSARYFERAYGAATGRSGDKGWLFITAYLLGLVLPIILVLQSAVIIWQFFLPLMGRSGTGVPSDIVVSAIMGALVAVVGLMAVSVVHLFRQWTRVRTVLGAVVLASLLAAMAVAPYSASTPKRVYMQHVSREFFPRGADSFQSHASVFAEALATDASSPLAARNLVRSALPRRDAGLWTIAMDRLNIAPLLDVRVPASLVGARATADDGTMGLFADSRELECSAQADQIASRLFCDMPYYLPLPSFVPGNRWLPLSAAMAPAQRLQPMLKLERVEELPALDGFRNHRRLHFVASNCASHATLYVNNRVGFSRPLAWSFGSSVSDSAALGRPSLGAQYQASPPQELFVFVASGMPLQAEDAEAAALQDVTSADSLPSDESLAQLRRELRFWIETGDAVDSPAGAYLDIALASHSLAADAHTFLESLMPYLPDWAAPVWFTSTYSSFHF